MKQMIENSVLQCTFDTSGKREDDRLTSLQARLLVLSALLENMSVLGIFWFPDVYEGCGHVVCCVLNFNVLNK